MPIGLSKSSSAQRVREVNVALNSSLENISKSRNAPQPAVGVRLPILPVRLPDQVKTPPFSR